MSKYRPLSTTRDEQWFVGAANPHSWLLTADNLHQQAVLLHGQRSRARITRRDKSGAFLTWDVVDRSVFLLGGFALENAIKAFLVYEHPSWISNGKLAKRLRSHSLLELRAHSKMIPYRSKYTWALRAFEEGLESWARYPCGLEATTSGDQGVISQDLWRAYLVLMHSYGRRLTELLGDGWEGPHGFQGRWDIERGFLAMCS